MSKKRSGAPDVGDLVVFNPGDKDQPVRLVVDTRGIEVLLVTPGLPHRWVRRDGVRIINESR